MPTNIIAGPDGISIKYDVNSPMMVELILKKSDKNTVCLNERARFLAIAAGNTSSPVISIKPIILMLKAMVKAVAIKKL